MPKSKAEIRDLYNRKSKELTGTVPTEEQVDEVYRLYLKGVQFTKSEGELLIEKSAQNTLEIYFRPSSPFPSLAT